jgi:hypothetical protein
MTKKLQHIVLIQFKENLSEQQLRRIEEEALTLKAIRGVNDLLFRANVSPEKLNKDYSHCLTLWFSNEEDRDKVYLPHSVHQRFVKFFVPFTEKVLVFDYWE